MYEKLYALISIDVEESGYLIAANRGDPAWPVFCCVFFISLSIITGSSG